MKIGQDFRNLMREPLAHFLVAGMLVFIVASWRGAPVDPAERTITIDEARVNWLASQFTQTWQRSPNPAEIDQLIREYVKEEVYYREALRMGLDQDDPIVRRRMRAKMEFLAASAVESETPDEATLQRWFDQNKKRYTRDALYSFDQIYLGAADDPGARERADALMPRLKAGAAFEGIGIPISLPATLEGAGQARIENDFGPDFAAALPAMKSDNWQGPIASGFGLHLVRVRAVAAGRVPPLADIRQQVENDWRTATREAREAAAYQALLDGYRVRIAKP